MIPNLDGMTHDDLMKFWKKYHRPKRKDAAELIGDTRKGYTNIAATVANYALLHAVAMTCRKRGDIQAALTYEHAADLAYDRLPDDLKW